MSLIAADDNRRAAGERSGNALRLRLVVETGRWQPEGPDGRTLLVQAFREEGGELTSPGPLVRVPAGSEIVVSVRNDPHERVSVFGFVTRPAMGPPMSLDVSPGETRETRFLASRAGYLPQSQRRRREAPQLVTVGETYDFEIQPALDRPLWLELRRGNGEWVAQVLLVATSDRTRK